MALDGAFLRHLSRELRGKILGYRINKIYQPAKYEINFLLRGQGDVCRLAISSSTQAPRINLTNKNANSLPEPPAFCMLLRKKIMSAKIVSIQQKLLERALSIRLETKDEMGYDTYYELIVEIMGKHSNIILVSSENKIVDSIKRVSSDMSSKRLVMPGFLYQDPPSQGKICILNSEKDAMLKTIFSFDPNKTLLSALQTSLQGLSKTICREMIIRAGYSPETELASLGPVGQEKIGDSLSFISDTIKNISGKPYLVEDENNKKDISFIRPKQDSYKEYSTFSELVDDYYNEKASKDRINSKAGTLIKLIGKIIALKKRKILQQKEELIHCWGKDKYKICGDLLISNLYKIKKGMKNIELVDFSTEPPQNIKITLDTKLDGSENAQKYYKKYKKLKTAQKFLTEQIENAHTDILYLDSTLDSLERCQSESEINEIQRELCEQGYIRLKNKVKAKNKSMGFIEFISPGGYKILVGRNCKQNAELTYKTAGKKDLWFHVKDMPGSHTVMFTGGNSPKTEDILFAASICAGHSKAKFSDSVAVDYTTVSNVKKPKNYRPGMAIYKNYKTLHVPPTEE